jgi:hypothetical protein
VDLSKSKNAFIRGSPTRGTLGNHPMSLLSKIHLHQGGVTRSTGDAIVLCEGYSDYYIQYS